MNDIEVLDLLTEISQMCIGEISLNYKLDAQYIGQRIYEVTGLTAPELLKKLDELRDKDS